MSIYREKKTKFIIQDAVEHSDVFFGTTQDNIEFKKVGYSISKSSAEQLFTESELQQKIESAVSEHQDSMNDTLQEWYDGERILQDKIEQLTKENEELKAKIPQPIVISQGLSMVIDWYKNKEHWEEKFIFSDTFPKTESVGFKWYKETSIFERIQIVKNGYVVKKSPEEELKIELDWAKENNSDHYRGMWSAIEKLGVKIKGINA